MANLREEAASDFVYLFISFLNWTGSVRFGLAGSSTPKPETEPNQTFFFSVFSVKSVFWFFCSPLVFPRLRFLITFISLDYKIKNSHINMVHIKIIIIIIQNGYWNSISFLKNILFCEKYFLYIFLKVIAVIVIVIIIIMLMISIIIVFIILIILMVIIMVLLITMIVIILWIFFYIMYISIYKLFIYFLSERQEKSYKKNYEKHIKYALQT
jgi:hypothetical protein